MLVCTALLASRNQTRSQIRLNNFETVHLEQLVVTAVQVLAVPTVPRGCNKSKVNTKLLLPKGETGDESAIHSVQLSKKTAEIIMKIETDLAVELFTHISVVKLTRGAFSS